MEELQLQSILEAYNQRLEEAKVLNLQSWILNQRCFEILQKQKAVSKLRTLLNFKIVAIILGLIWVWFLGYLFYFSFRRSQLFFAVSSGAILLITLIAIVVYISHVVLIDNINNTENVIKAQEKIAHLQISTINITRILFLQTPFYCTFWWNIAMIAKSPASFWLISVPVALLFTFFSIWLFRNISLKNQNKKWFKILFNSPEWNSLVKADTFLEEINSFKKEM